MLYSEFRKLHPAIRYFQQYGPETRAERLASRRLGHRQRESMGEFFYTHPMVPNIAFPSARAATLHAYEIHRRAK